jgi:DNA-binding transcriptional ArsR family regulator
MLLPQNETDVPDEFLLSLLSSSAASAILATLDEPMTAKEISHFSGVPLSTTYREVNRLSEADLVEESIRLDPVRGKHVSEYVRAFDSVEITVGDGGIAVEVIS